MTGQRIRIKLKSYDHRLIDKWTDRIIKTIKSTFKLTTASSLNRLIRARKLSAKQASQNQRVIEKEEKKRAKLAKKPKTTNTT